MCPLHVWRGEWRQRRVFVLEIKLHTHGSSITNCCWAIGISLSSQEMVRIGWGSKAVSSRYYRSFFNQKGVALEPWIWMADGSSSILVLLLVCLLKRMWRFSQASGCQTVCQIKLLWDRVSSCWSSRYWIGRCAYCRCMSQCYKWMKHYGHTPTIRAVTRQPQTPRSRGAQPTWGLHFLLYYYFKTWYFWSVLVCSAIFKTKLKRIVNLKLHKMLKIRSLYLYVSAAALQFHLWCNRITIALS